MSERLGLPTALQLLPGHFARANRSTLGLDCVRFPLSLVGKVNAFTFYWTLVETIPNISMTLMASFPKCPFGS